MDLPLIFNIAANYPSEGKNCASDVFVSNLSNPLPPRSPYSFTQNHYPDTSPLQPDPSRQVAATTPTGAVLAPGLHTAQKAA